MTINKEILSNNTKHKKYPFVTIRLFDAKNIYL